MFACRHRQQVALLTSAPTFPQPATLPNQSRTLPTPEEHQKNTFREETCKQASAFSVKSHFDGNEIAKREAAEATQLISVSEENHKEGNDRAQVDLVGQKKGTGGKRSASSHTER